MTYKMNYDGDQPEQDATRRIPDNAPVPYVEKPRSKFAVPSILKTTATFLVAGAVFFSIEAFAPGYFKPSTILGTYEAKLQAAVKAAELQQQAKYEGWAAEVKIASEQNVKQYEAVTQGILRNYDANYQLTNTVMGGYIQLHQQYKGVLYDYTRQTRSADIGILNLSRGIGLVMNLLEPGAGDPALSYSERLNAEIKGQFRSAAGEDFPLQMKDWQSRLATPAEVRAELNSIQLMPLPPLPDIGEDAPRQNFSASSVK